MRRFGRQVTRAIPFAIPPVILAILASCVVIWFLEAATWSRWSFWGDWLALSVDGLGRGRIFQLVTYQFLHDHASLFHVLFNALLIAWFGADLERRWGGGGLLRYYVACGIGGGLAYAAVAFALRDPSRLVGASAAGLGLAVAYAMIWPERQFLLLFVIPVTARQLVFILVLVDLMAAWLRAFGGSATGAVAHLGGMLTGWLYLKHAWRLRSPKGLVGAPWAALRQAWRRRRMRVVDRDFEKWLRDQDDDTRH